MTASIVPWGKQLDTAIIAAQDRPGHRLAQLATIRGPGNSQIEGRPSCRTVNIRRCENRKLYFVSDTRSGKANDVINGTSSFAELCWYFPEVKKQFRLNGKVALHQNDMLTQVVWAQLSSFERRWWSWPNPGEPRGELSEFDVPVPEGAPAHFCICELDPDYVDVVDLMAAPFMREAHQRESTVTDEESKLWKVQMLNP